MVDTTSSATHKDIKMTDILPTIPSKKLSLNKIEKIVDAVSVSERTPEEYCVKAGIDLLAVYKTLGEIALRANITAKDKYGEVIELGADNRARMAAIALILELNKHIKDKNVVTQVGIFNDPRVIEEANRVLGLKNRMSE
jgi:hypothetical protein